MRCGTLVGNGKGVKLYPCDLPYGHTGKHKPADPEQAFLRHLVDVVWNAATESESVPATEWADRLIAQARETFTP